MMERFGALLAQDADYQGVSRGFLRLLALIYLAAFYSAAVEIQGLVGAQGILPAGDYLLAAEQRFAEWRYLRLPTLFWIDHRDELLVGAAWLGCFFSLLLLIGRAQVLATSVLFVLYLSLFRVGQTFFNFQWDYLLLESGFLAICLAVMGPSRALIFLFHWLLFRLRFLSGASKLLSEDPSWRGLTTLNHYFETQPLPHLGAWFAHQLPEALLRAGTTVVLFAELIVPFFIFLPRPFRLFAAALTILIQLLIIATSNHNFINLLTIALCLFLLDDRALARMLPFARRPSPPVRRGRLAQTLFVAFGAVLLITSSYSAAAFLGGWRESDGTYAPINWVRAWGLANVYHVFPNMQTERHELIIEGSQDGARWQAYRFRHKPDDADDIPGFIVPLHPRLDWMMWFIPPQNPMMRQWFESFMWRLHRNEPSVTGLLQHNPFADKAPGYLRIRVYRYWFSTPAQRANGAPLWQTEYLGEFPRVRPRNP